MASDSEEARAYVHRALGAGRPVEAIRDDLMAAGWSEPQVSRAVEAWMPGPDGVPVPRPKLQLSARDAFLYLTLFAALYISAWHFGALVFDLIELALPDPAERPQHWRADSIRFSVASLIVAFPLFLGLTARLNREIARDPVRRDSAVRQWLGHLTMFLAVIALIGSTISVIYGLLSGDLTLHFLLKVATVVVIAGVILGWFRMQLRPVPRAGRRTARGRR